ncbi:hypothetical protein [Tropicibacter naphthalenivorans]|uniref:Uncharacterized protein n=1 Tax=Tropicibacter naphthalenivorans TaxID=441103 RepID=A0A0P1GA09_9RHOB|nr:hypothetical protein [Tropicibacter naphthalenivorans]CUH78264.1 hypothetical protein TRN7648_01884 [Tropicibacter naphthalenivorans]SMC78811.1 hypothetical protein SAMN04488093_10446 [Tropicibacter naphthalenivorans]
MNAPLHAPARLDAARLREMRRKIGPMRASTYDISAVCNLTFEG